MVVCAGGWLHGTQGSSLLSSGKACDLVTQLHRNLWVSHHRSPQGPTDSVRDPCLVHHPGALEVPSLPVIPQ